ncbi:acyltransferase family protein [Tardiphaga sp. P5_C7]
MNNNSAYLPRLDHLRFLAVSMVVVFHCLILLPGRPASSISFPLIQQGHMGVQLFMVISGFIMTTKYIDCIDVRAFYLNRIVRIYPLFVLIIALGYFATPDPRPASVGLDFVFALLPISNLYRLNYGEFGGHLWSIAVELQFYALFPLLLHFRKLYEAKLFYPSVIMAAIALRAAIFFTTGTAHQVAFFTIFGSIDLFIGGMIASEVYSKMRRNGVTVSLWWSLAVVTIITLITAQIFKAPSFFHVDYGKVASDGISRSPIWIFWPCLQAATWGTLAVTYLLSSSVILGSRTVAKLGEWSYSAYIWHILVITALKGQFLGMSPMAFGFLIILPVTVAISFFSFTIIEQPFNKLRRKAPTPDSSDVGAVDTQMEITTARLP